MATPKLEDGDIIEIVYKTGDNKDSGETAATFRGSEEGYIVIELATGEELFIPHGEYYYIKRESA
jgi:hypothetical protein